MGAVAAPSHVIRATMSKWITHTSGQIGCCVDAALMSNHLPKINVFIAGLRRRGPNQLFGKAVKAAGAGPPCRRTTRTSTEGWGRPSPMPRQVPSDDLNCH